MALEPVHALDRELRHIRVLKADEAEAFALPLLVRHDPYADNCPKLTERLHKIGLA